jgi:hypothetical protein
MSPQEQRFVAALEGAMEHLDRLGADGDDAATSMGFDPKQVLATAGGLFNYAGPQVIERAQRAGVPITHGEMIASAATSVLLIGILMGRELAATDVTELRAIVDGPAPEG